MRGLIIPTLGILVLIGIALFLTPVQRMVYDPAPSSEDMAETVIIAQPLPPVPVPAAMQTAAAPSSAPLPKKLILREKVSAQVAHGQVTLPAGMPVELTRDKGETVEVQFGAGKQATRTTVPRKTVSVPALPPPTEVSGPLAVVRKTVLELDRAPASSIAIEAKEVGTGRGVARSYDPFAGTTDQNAYRTKGLNVTVRNLSRRPTGPCEVTVYWTGRRLADNQLHITHGESFSANLIGVSEHAETSWCPLLDSQVTTYETSNVRSKSGSKFDGWFVVLTREKEMLVGRGATETYNQIIRNSAQLEPLLATWSGSSLHATADRPMWRHERPGQTASPQEKRSTSPY